jgi:heme exporter protein D
MSEFFAMGGYADYVWWSYGITAVILIGLATVAIQRGRTRRADLEELQARLGPSRRGADQ